MSLGEIAPGLGCLLFQDLLGIFSLHTQARDGRGVLRETGMHSLVVSPLGL